MRTRQSGFSLIELMVAMVVTLFVTGAVYGLLTGGQSAFRREPELSDRQQNIRVAMDMIMRDVASAGSGMPDFIQTFTPNLNALGPFVGPSGERTDELEIMANTGDFAAETACGYPGGASEHTFMLAGTTHVREGQLAMVVMQDGTWTMKEMVDATGPAPPTSEGDCEGGTPHKKLGFNAGLDQSGYNTPSGLCAGTRVIENGQCVGCTYRNNVVPGTACCSADCQVAYIISGSVVRYRIRTGPDGVPNLERFSSDFSDNFAGGAQQFQVVARGIDDLQVRYTPAGQTPCASQTCAFPGVETDSAPRVDQARLDYGTLIQSVTVTLSARSEAPNVAGMRRAAAGPDALRGQLVSTGSPRATLKVLGSPDVPCAVGATLTNCRTPGWVGPVAWK